MVSTRFQTGKEILDLVKSELAEVEKEFRQQSVSNVRPITEIGQYLQFSGGKRLRPALVLLSSKLCGYEGSAAIRLGAVVELIHTATLIHDDVIDEAETRRGRASTNSRWGNHTSVLAGDWLYMQAFSIALTWRNFRILDLLISLTREMVEGELLQMNQLKQIGLMEADYLELCDRKTACLFSACLRLGSMLGDSTEDLELKLGSYGTNLGLAFQVIDDLLDFTSSEETLGKPIGSDLREGKITLPLIYLLAKCTSAEKAKIARVLEEGGFHSVQFDEILELIERYNILQAARAKAQHFAALAEASLEGIPESRYRDALRSLAEFIADRQY
ncbi:MAG: polyprenyl synthetase family protein [Terriglobia bacterium]